MVRDMHLQIIDSDPVQYLGQGSISSSQGTEGLNKDKISEQNRVDRKRKGLWNSVGETQAVVGFIGNCCTLKL